MPCLPARTRSASCRRCCRASWRPSQGVVVLLPARDGEIAPVKLGGVVGGVCSDGRRKHRTHGDRAHREGGGDPLLQGHLHIETLY